MLGSTSAAKKADKAALKLNQLKDQHFSYILKTLDDLLGRSIALKHQVLDNLSASVLSGLQSSLAVEFLTETTTLSQKEHHAFWDQLSKNFFEK
jgi:flagellar motor switch protein FliG